MKINQVLIQDTFAEAWDLEVTRLLLTAISEEVAQEGAHQFVGAAGSSMLGSRINGGIERVALPQETPDGRPGVIVSLTMPPDKREEMVQELALRTVLATLVPTIAVFDFPVPEVKAKVGADIYARTRHWWQGYESERVVAGHTLCVVPTTTGEFLYEKSFTISTEGTDGHIVCYADNAASAVLAIQAAKVAIRGVDGVSPMGYGLEQVFRELDYVPALRGKIEKSRVPEGTVSILNLLMFGATSGLMRRAMKVAIEAAAGVPGVREIGAMNFGGEFGKHQYHLHELLAGR
ncbi:MAG: formylmethanofuran--tetrahydromethanopterin N-formyltransferase [Anaerolineales bacterium]